MSSLRKPLPVNDNRVVRIRQKGISCHIAGGIESETTGYFRTIKTMGEFFIRKRIAKASAHTEPCPHCPSDKAIRDTWLQPGIDPYSDSKSA